MKVSTPPRAIDKIYAEGKDRSKNIKRIVDTLFHCVNTEKGAGTGRQA